MHIVGPNYRFSNIRQDTTLIIWDPFYYVEIGSLCY